MYNLLIVDDEIYAVEALKSGVDWSSLGFAQVYEAFNVREAQDIILNASIDVVICDIEMPGGDGFELLEWIRGTCPELALLFLTCHAEFRYAKRAIQLGVQEYLLKPVDYGELKTTVEGIVSLIRAERDWKAAERMAQAFWENKRPLLYERFWQEVLNSRTASTRGQLRKALQEFRVPFDPDRMELLPILISVEQWAQALTEADEELMEYAVRKVAEEMILDGADGCTIQERHRANLVLIYCGKTEKTNLASSLIKSCESFIQYAEEHLYCRLSCYIGEKTPIEQVKQEYESLLKMEYNNITPSSAVHLFREGVEKGSPYPSVDMSDWPTLIEQGAERDLRLRIHQSLSALKFEGGGAEALLIYYHSVLQTIYFVLQKRGRSVQDIFKEADVLDISSFPKTIAQMEDWTVRVTGHVSRYLGLEEESVVHRVREYIKAHLDDRIERTELAEYVHLNPAYLSRLFKKETGQSLSEFILSQKMELSRQLLKNSSRSISEIAGIAGYSNLSYFSKAFKKMFHISPMAYRKDAKSEAKV